MRIHLYENPAVCAHATLDVSRKCLNVGDCGTSDGRFGCSALLASGPWYLVPQLSAVLQTNFIESSGHCRNPGELQRRGVHRPRVRQELTGQWTPPGASQSNPPTPGQSDPPASGRGHRGCVTVTQRSFKRVTRGVHATQLQLKRERDEEPASFCGLLQVHSGIVTRRGTSLRRSAHECQQKDAACGAF